MYFQFCQDKIEIINAKCQVKGYNNRVELYMNLANLEKGLVHSSCMPTFIKYRVPLLVVSGSHEEVNLYNDKWTVIEVPPYTCLLYADTTLKYRCTVDGESIIFDVKDYQYLTSAIC